MGEESGLCPAEPTIEVPLISPLHDLGLNGPDNAERDSVQEQRDEGQEVEEVEEDEVRTPRVPHDPGRPTRKELAEHLPLHWPFRSWCRHCVRGRAVSSPHKRRTDEDRDFGRGRIPTLSMDHCFLGSANAPDESAHENPFLVLYDNETESIFAIAVQSKSTKTWVVEYVKNVLHELGYGEVKVAIKCDQARELK